MSERHPADKGIPCPDCGSTYAEVKDTRHSAGTIRRRRICASCNAIFTTRELSEVDVRRLRHAADTLARVRAFFIADEPVVEPATDEAEAQPA